MRQLLKNVGVLDLPKGKAPTRAGSVKPSAKPATQSGKPAAKGNGAKRPAR
ncbi:MAG: hypothetical protein ACRDCX_01130 [Aeromonas sp.]